MLNKSNWKRPRPLRHFPHTSSQTIQEQKSESFEVKKTATNNIIFGVNQIVAQTHFIAKKKAKLKFTYKQTLLCLLNLRQRQQRMHPNEKFKITKFAFR